MFRNCTVILISDAGRSKPSIAEALGCGTATVDRVRRLYRTMGIRRLTPIKPPGRPAPLSEALGEPVREAVQADPRTFGYGFTTGSVARLTEHLRRRCRLRASPGTVRRVLAHERFSLQRPKHTLEGKRDEKAHAKAKKKLTGLKKALRKNAAEALVFQDETEIHTHPVLTRMWARVGRQPRIFSPGQNQKKVVYGAVDYATGKITTTIADTKSGLHFIEFLTALVRSYAGRKIRLVCDNARYIIPAPCRVGWMVIGVGSRSIGCRRTAQI